MWRRRKISGQCRRVPQIRKLSKKKDLGCRSFSAEWRYEINDMIVNACLQKNIENYTDTKINSTNRRQSPPTRLKPLMNRFVLIILAQCHWVRSRQWLWSILCLMQSDSSWRQIIYSIISSSLNPKIRYKPNYYKNRNPITRISNGIILIIIYEKYC